MKKLICSLLVILTISAQAQFIEREDRDKRYPVPAAWDRQTIHKIGMFTHMGEITRTCRVAKSSQPVPLPRTPRDLSDVKYQAIFNYTLKEHLDKNYVMGLTFVRDGKIVDQHYQYERRENDLFTSFSAGKSIISILIGIAYDEGLIKSLDDQATKYTNRISESSYSNIKIRSLLRMSSGIPYTEPGGDSGIFDNAVRLDPNSDITKELNKWQRTSANEGAKFYYASIETAVLTEVLRGATGKNVCEYAQEKLWEPIGAEYDARMETDGSGNVIGYSGFNATQTDYAKVGVMLANNGIINGRRVLSSEYIDQATNTDRQPNKFKADGLQSGYGYQFWLRREPGRYYMNGSYGQYVFIDRDSKSVLVIHTADPVKDNQMRSARTIRLFQSLINNTNLSQNQTASQ
jgi:CubicO group peptidase (beta-lactamase class C family)